MQLSSLYSVVISKVIFRNNNFNRDRYAVWELMPCFHDRVLQRFFSNCGLITRPQLFDTLFSRGKISKVDVIKTI